MAPGKTPSAPETTSGKVCDEMEFIDTLIATNSLHTTPHDVPNKKHLIAKGVDFIDTNPVFLIDVPEGGAIIRNIKLSSKNVIRVEITFTTPSGRKISLISDSPTAIRRNQFPTEKVTTIVVKVIKTTNGDAPRDVTLSVIACAEGTTTVTSPGKKVVYSFNLLAK